MLGYETIQSTYSQGTDTWKDVTKYTMISSYNPLIIPQGKPERNEDIEPNMNRGVIVPMSEDFFNDLIRLSRIKLAQAQREEPIFGANIWDAVRIIREWWTSSHGTNS
jgi:hypothetical protein